MSVNTTFNKIDSEIAEVELRINKETITKQIDDFIEVIASDGFIGYINDVAQLPTHAERKELTAKTANLETLRERGVPVPDGLRFTTREFELPEDCREAEGPLLKVRPELDPRMGGCISIGFYVCASYGN